MIIFLFFSFRSFFPRLLHVTVNEHTFIFLNQVWFMDDEISFTDIKLTLFR